MKTFSYAKAQVSIVFVTILGVLAWVKGGFFKADTRALIFTPQITVEGNETTVGLGWRVGKDSIDSCLMVG